MGGWQGLEVGKTVVLKMKEESMDALSQVIGHSGLKPG